MYTCIKTTKGTEMNFIRTEQELLNRIMLNPSAYVGRFNNLETARRMRTNSKGLFIVKVSKEYWVACGRYAGILNRAGFEYIR